MTAFYGGLFNGSVIRLACQFVHDCFILVDGVRFHFMAFAIIDMNRGIFILFAIAKLNAIICQDCVYFVRGKLGRGALPMHD